MDDVHKSTSQNVNPKHVQWPRSQKPDNLNNELDFIKSTEDLPTTEILRTVFASMILTLFLSDEYISRTEHFEARKD